VIGPLRTDNAVLLRTIVEADNAVRGYQVTGDPVTLELWATAVDDYRRIIDSLQDRADGHEDWQRLIDEQDALAREWYDRYAVQVILLVAADDPAAVNEGTVEIGESLINQIRDVNAELGRRAAEFRDERRDAIHTRTLIAVIAIATILVAALAILYWRSRRVRRLVADPLADLLITVSAFQAGDLAARPNVRGSREVEALARALDQVASWAQQLIQADRQRLHQAGLIRELTSHVHEGLDERDVLDRAVRQLGPALGADRVLVMALNNEGQLGAVLAEWVADGFTALGVGGQMPSDPDRDAAIRSGVDLGGRSRWRTWPNTASFCRLGASFSSRSTSERCCSRRSSLVRVRSPRSHCSLTAATTSGRPKRGP